VPFFRLCMARLTDRFAPLPYRAILSDTSSSRRHAKKALHHIINSV
jgi:hypothetical protein